MLVAGFERGGSADGASSPRKRVSRWASLLPPKMLLNCHFCIEIELNEAKASGPRTFIRPGLGEMKVCHHLIFNWK